MLLTRVTGGCPPLAANNSLSSAVGSSCAWLTAITGSHLNERRRDSGMGPCSMRSLMNRSMAGWSSR
ncbi:MAG: hypothetical protein WCY32_05250, partial [Burkholderiaceae bacterium]